MLRRALHLTILSSAQSDHGGALQNGVQIQTQRAPVSRAVPRPPNARASPPIALLSLLAVATIVPPPSAHTSPRRCPIVAIVSTILHSYIHIACAHRASATPRSRKALVIRTVNV